MSQSTLWVFGSVVFTFRMQTIGSFSDTPWQPQNHLLIINLNHQPRVRWDHQQLFSPISCLSYDVCQVLLPLHSRKPFNITLVRVHLLSLWAYAGGKYLYLFNFFEILKFSRLLNLCIHAVEKIFHFRSHFWNFNCFWNFEFLPACYIALSSCRWKNFHSRSHF